MKHRQEAQVIFFICLILISFHLAGCTKLNASQTYSPPTYEPFYPGEELASDEMRITFVGTSFLPRLAQECNSIYVELGNKEYFMFDMGSGVSAKYVALGIPYSRMDKVFLTHLHGDHTSDLITMYCFGPSNDRKTPLQVWGPTGNDASEGTQVWCDNLKKLMKWHILSFSFEETGYGPGNDGYDIDVHELDWKTTGVAYEKNGVKITYFPAVHTRNGSISYKLEWNDMSMVFSGDTKPNDYLIAQAKNVDVLIHEMVVPPDVWAMKNGHFTSTADPNYPKALKQAQDVQESSHTPELAFGYILSQTNPRLGVATHFQVNEDTLPQAISNIQYWYHGPIAIATDLLVINVSHREIRQRRAVVSDYAWYAKPNPAAGQLAPPMFPTPTYQLDQKILLDHVIPESVYDIQADDYNK